MINGKQALVLLAMLLIALYTFYTWGALALVGVFLAFVLGAFIAYLRDRYRNRTSDVV